MTKLVKHWLTSHDNATYDIVRGLVTLIGVPALIALQFMNWEKFEPISFATGVAIVVGVIGANDFATKPKEPAP